MHSFVPPTKLLVGVVVLFAMIGCSSREVARDDLRSSRAKIRVLDRSLASEQTILNERHDAGSGYDADAHREVVSLGQQLNAATLGVDLAESFDDPEYLDDANVTIASVAASMRGTPAGERVIEAMQRATSPDG